jgi:hypothetical protein
MAIGALLVTLSPDEIFSMVLDSGRIFRAQQLAGGLA